MHRDEQSAVLRSKSAGRQRAGLSLRLRWIRAQTPQGVLSVHPWQQRLGPFLPGPCGSGEGRAALETLRRQQPVRQGYANACDAEGPRFFRCSLASQKAPEPTMDVWLPSPSRLFGRSLPRDLTPGPRPPLPAAPASNTAATEQREGKEAEGWHWRPQDSLAGTCSPAQPRGHAPGWSVSCGVGWAQVPSD